MKKIILLVVAVVMVTMLSGCATFGTDKGSVGSRIEAAETDLTQIGDIVKILDSAGWVDSEQASEVNAKIEEAKKLLESAKAAQSISDKVASEQYMEALLEIMLELEKYKEDK